MTRDDEANVQSRSADHEEHRVRWRHVKVSSHLNPTKKKHQRQSAEFSPSSRLLLLSKFLPNYQGKVYVQRPLRHLKHTHRFPSQTFTFLWSTKYSRVKVRNV